MEEQEEFPVMEPVRSMFPPLMSGKQVGLNVEEVAKIIRMQGSTSYVPHLPIDPKGGDIYILRPESDDLASCWKADGKQWKISGTCHLPRVRKPLFCKRTYSHVNPSGTIDTSMKKEVFAREVGEEDGNVCLVHYLGQFSESTTDLDEGQNNDQALSKTVNVHADSTTCEPGERRDPRSSTTGELDLESAMKTMKAALAARSGSTPVVDVFNKLLESVVNDPSNPDLEYCLVVKNKRSGERATVADSQVAHAATPAQLSQKAVDKDVEAGTARSLRKRQGQSDAASNIDAESAPASKRTRQTHCKTTLTRATEVEMSNGEVMTFPPPKNESIFSYCIVAEEEKRINRDLFDGQRGTRGKDKYLKMRNLIIEGWTKQKPICFSVDQALQKLSTIGDDKQIARIHSYLEAKGVINFKAVPSDKPEGNTLKSKNDITVNNPQSENPRKRGRPKKKSTENKIKSVTLQSNPSKRNDNNNSTEMDTDEGLKLQTSVGKSYKGERGRDSSSGTQTPVTKEKKDECDLSASGRRTRNASSRNWKDILSGKAEFSKGDKYILAWPQTSTFTPKQSSRKSLVKTPQSNKSKKVAVGTDGNEDKKESKVELMCDRAVDSNKSMEKHEQDGENVPAEYKSTMIDPPNACREVIEGSNAACELPQLDPKALDNTNISENRSPMKKAKVKKMGNKQLKSACLKPVEFKPPPTADMTPGRSTRIRVSYECTTCLKRFSVKYLLDEHVKQQECSINDRESTLQCLDDDKDMQPATSDKAIGDLDVNEDDDDSDFILIQSDHAASGKQSVNYKLMKAKDMDIPPDRLKALRLGRVKRAPRTPQGKEKPTCSECGSVFLSEANLRRHLLLHSNKMYECPFCAKIMKRKDYILTHIRKVHREVSLNASSIDWTNYTHDITKIRGRSKVTRKKDGSDSQQEGEQDIQSETEFSCPLCQQGKSSREELEKHMHDEHSKDLKDYVYTCSVCSEEFHTYLEFEVHKISHKRKSHPCPHCKRVFQSLAKLQIHKRHDHNIQYGTLMYFGFLMNNEQIACEICSSEFESMAKYHDHRPVHLTLEHLCRECGNGFMSRHELDKHVQSKCTYQHFHLPCGACDQRFTIYDTRRKHILSFHPKETDYYCHHCGVSFEDIESLRKHFPIHKSEKIYECEFCEKRFFEKRNLVDHRELHKSSKNFKCHLCDRMYISAKSLQRHLKLHLGQEKKRCRFCNNLFSTNEELYKHEKTHDDESDTPDGGFPCNMCSKRFSTKPRLVKHMQMHGGGDHETTYKCNICNEMFNIADMPMWKHLKQEHPEEAKKQKKDLICETCGFMTIHRQRMQRHKETHYSDKRFVCKVCHKRFQTTSSLLTHMIIHRGKVRKGLSNGYTCSWPGCEKLSAKRSYNKKHLTSHIFRIKIGRDPCLCKTCNPTTGNENNYILLQEGADGTLQFVENRKNNTKDDGSDGQTMSVVLNSQSYESMNVLQEAIAQIEDIEKNTDRTITDKLEFQEGTQNKQKISEAVTLAGHTAATGTLEDNMSLALNQANTISPTAEEIDALSSVHGSLNIANQSSIMAERVSSSSQLLLENTEVIINTGDSANQSNVEIPTSHSKPIESNEYTIVGETTNINVNMFKSETGSLTNVEGDGLYECGTCDDKFDTKCQVLQHFETTHPEDAFPVCSVCNKVFLDQKNLNEHMSIHTGNKDFMCDVCKKYFRTKQCLRQHQFIHADVKPYICSYCGHGFTQRGFFEEHVRRHTGHKPYKCPDCSKSFVSKNLLRIHSYSHSGSKPHKCEYCPKSFTENYQLMAHMRVHNQERPYQCNLCDKSFFVKAKVIRHLNTVHNIDKSMLTNFVPTRIREGVGYRDKTKLKNYLPDPEPRKTQVVYIDSQGNIVSQVMKTAEEIKKEKEVKKIELQKQIKPQQAPFMFIKPLEQIPLDDASSHSDSLGSFEVFTRRDSSGQIKVDTVVTGPEHMIVESTETGDTIVSIPDTDPKPEDIQYGQFQPIENDGSIDLDGQNYTFVSADGQTVESHLELITHALHSHGDGEGGEIQLVTEEITEGQDQVTTDGNIEIYANMIDGGLEEVGETPENFSINIGEDGSVDPADYEKIEALRNLYTDQPIVIVVEQHQQD